jgi:hypothetical protein
LRSSLPRRGNGPSLQHLSFLAVQHAQVASVVSEIQTYYLRDLRPDILAHGQPPFRALELVLFCRPQGTAPGVGLLIPFWRGPGGRPGVPGRRLGAARPEAFPAAPCSGTCVAPRAIRPSAP